MPQPGDCDNTLPDLRRRGLLPGLEPLPGPPNVPDLSLAGGGQGGPGKPQRCKTLAQQGATGGEQMLPSKIRFGRITG